MRELGGDSGSSYSTGDSKLLEKKLKVAEDKNYALTDIL